MLKVTKKVEYALMALKYMNSLALEEEKSSHRPVSARELSEHFLIPFDTMAKMMQLMSQRGYLQSIQGASGGYILSKKVSKASFYEIYQLIESFDFDKQCEECKLQTTCNIESPLKKLNRRLSHFYKSIPLEELFCE